MNIINAYGTQYFSKELPFVQRCCVHVTQHHLSKQMEPRFKIEGPSRQLSAHKHIKHCAVCWECGHDLTIMYEQMLVLSFHCGNWRALHQHDA